MSSKKIVAGYGRVSTVRQVLQGTSAEDQRQRIAEYCIRQGYELHEFYADEGFSGKTMEHRPGMQNLIADAKAGKFSAVLFTKLDRVGRNLREVLDFWHLINETYSLELVSIDNPELNTKGSLSRVILALLGSFAEFERDLIRERMSGGRLIRWKKKEAVVGALPYGYAWKDKATEVQPEQAAVVRQIYSMYLDQNFTIKQIAIQLTEAGVSSPSSDKGWRKGAAASKWNTITVAKILKRKAYTGDEIVLNHQIKRTIQSQRTKRPYRTVTKDLKPSDQWVSVSFPPLITPDTWEQAQRRLLHQRRKPKKRHKGHDEHFMAENVVRCGECGGRMRKMLKVEPSGKERFYYACYWKACNQKELTLRGRERCILDSVDAEHVDRVVWGRIVMALSNPVEFAAQWFGDPDIDQLRSHIAQLSDEERAASAKAKVGFTYLTTVEDPDLQQTYRAELERYEEEYREKKQFRERAELELAAVENKLHLITAFKKEIEEGAKAGSGGWGIWGNKAFVKSRKAIPEFLATLPFAEKKRILEAVVSPENDGKVLVRYQQARDVMDDEEVRNFDMKSLIKPQMDAPKYVDCQFFLDVGKLKAVVTSLNKKKLLEKLDSVGVPRRRHRIGRWRRGCRPDGL